MTFKANIWTTPEWVKFWANPKRMGEYNNCTFEYRDVTDEEIRELRIPVKIVEVAIPIEAVENSENIQKKLASIDLIYSGLYKRTYGWYLHIENIDLNDVPWYLSLEEYTALKAVWTIFPQEIIDLFENTNENNENEEVSENNDENTETNDENETTDENVDWE